MWLLNRRKTKTDQEATAALNDAEKNLRRIKRRSDEVTEVSESLKEIRQNNHFAEAMEEIILRNREIP